MELAKRFFNRHRIISVFIQLSIHCLLYHYSNANKLYMQSRANFSVISERIQFLSSHISERFISVIYFTALCIHALIHGKKKTENSIPILEYVSVFYLASTTY